MQRTSWPSEQPVAAGRHFGWKPGIDWQLLLIVVGVVGVLLAVGTGLTFVVAGLNDLLAQIGTALDGTRRL